MIEPSIAAVRNSLSVRFGKRKKKGRFKNGEAALIREAFRDLNAINKHRKALESSRKRIREHFSPDNKPSKKFINARVKLFLEILDSADSLRAVAQSL